MTNYGVVIPDSATRSPGSIWTTVVWAAICLDRGSQCHECNILFLMCPCVHP